MKAITISNIEILVEEAEEYIQINDIQEKDIEKIWEPLARQYPGYRVIFCFRDTPAPVDSLTAIGAEILEDCLKVELTPQDFASQNFVSQDIMPHDLIEMRILENDDFASFSSLHDNLHPEMYWTSQRILNNRDIWRIFVIKSGNELSGYVMLMNETQDKYMAEIFCIYSCNPDDLKALFSAAAQCAFDNGKMKVIYMADHNNFYEQEAAFATGFRVVGYYQEFQVKFI